MDNFQSNFNQLFNNFMENNCEDDDEIKYSLKNYLVSIKNENFLNYFFEILPKDNRLIRQFFDELTNFLLKEIISISNDTAFKIFTFYTLFIIWKIMNKKYSLLALRIRIDIETLQALKLFIENQKHRNLFDIFVAYKILSESGAFAYCQEINLLGPYYKDYINKTVKTEISDNVIYFLKIYFKFI